MTSALAGRAYNRLKEPSRTELRLAEHLILLYAFGSPCLYGLIQIGGTKLALSDILAVPALLLCISLSARRLPTGISVALLGYALFATVSSLRWLDTNHFVDSFLRALRLVGIVTPALLAGLLRNRLNLAKILKAVYIGGLVGILIAIVGFYLKWDLTAAKQSFTYHGELRQRGGGLYNETGAFGHVLAIWLGSSLILAATRWRKNKLHSALWVCTNIALFSEGLAISVSRSAILDVATMLLAVMLLPEIYKPITLLRNTAISGVLAIFIVLTGGMVAAGNHENDTSTSTITGRLVETTVGLEQGDALDDITSGRFEGWKSNLRVWSENPILGVGYKSVALLTDLYGDCNFINALVETGILGFACYMTAIVGITRRCWKLYLSNPMIGRLMLALWLGQVAHSLTEDILTFAGSAPLILIIFAGIPGVTRPKQYKTSGIDLTKQPLYLTVEAEQHG